MKRNCPAAKKLVQFQIPIEQNTLAFPQEKSEQTNLRIEISKILYKYVLFNKYNYTCKTAS